MAPGTYSFQALASISSFSLGTWEKPRKPDLMICADPLNAVAVDLVHFNSALSNVGVAGLVYDCHSDAV